MRTITKIILKNFKRFKNLEIDVNPEMNIFIGDNESGKSSILQAIELVSRGSRYKIEGIGLERLFNVEVINTFLKKGRDYKDLPELRIELYFTEQNNEFLNGNNNIKKTICDGIKLVCSPNDDFSKQIKDILSQPNPNFPFEFYKIDFKTFADQSFNGYNKQLQVVNIDNSQVGISYSMNEYVRNIYLSRISDTERITIKQQYHQHKNKFKDEVLSRYNNADGKYKFSIKDSSDSNIETEVTLLAENVPIENKGTGMQCFIKTELALQKAEDNIDAILLEEPESHLSYIKMLELINLIKEAKSRQIFIATHSDLISTRLNLRNCFLMNSQTDNCISLSNISEETAKFFMKAPDNNMLQYVLSSKAILVEGDAEFILMEAMFKNVIGQDLQQSEIGVIAVDGKCFKRYLEIAKELKIKTAVITDNDKDYEKNIVNNYNGYYNNEVENVKIFADEDNNRHTFEVCVYNDNKAICDELFKRGDDAQKFMLSNKAEAAYRLLTNKANEIVVPQYIKNAIEWVNA